MSLPFKGLAANDSLRQLYENSTHVRASSLYSGLVMRGAFVVQLRHVTQGSQLEGIVEEVDTGKQAKFLSENALIEFLRERFAQTHQSGQHKEGRNEPKDDRR